MTVADTIPKLLMENDKKYGNNKIAMRKKEFGIWNEYSWKNCYEHVKYFCLGLVSLGFGKGDKAAIVGDNDPQWFWGEWAAQAVGGVAVGLFVDSILSEVEYILKHCEAKFVIAKDQEQVDKILKLKDNLPQLVKVIYWESKGLWKYEESLILSWDKVEKLGRKYEETHPGVFEEMIHTVKPDDIAFITYTSGTTGLPKGAVHSHKTAILCSQNQLKLYPWYSEDDYLSYLSPAWIGEQCLGMIAGLKVAAVVNFPEEPETVTENIKEIGPRFLLFNPRMWESMASTVLAKMLDAGLIQRFFYHLFLPVGYKMIDFQIEGKKAPILWKLLHRIADFVIFRCLRDRLGLSKLRFGINGGGPLSPDCFRFFRAIGVPLVQEFGLSELLPVTGHSKGFDLDSIGHVAPGAEIKIGENNEILIRGEGLFLGYYKNPEETEKACAGGWFHTGDAGNFDGQGRLIYWDRVKDLVELSSGVKFPPQYIEGKLKFSPYIKDCMAMGGKERAYVAAIIAIDFEVCGRWAEGHSLPYTTIIDLSQKDQICELIKKEINAVNRTLPEAQQVKKFVNLYKEFDPDEAELTRTRKLRRSFMEEKYKGLVEALYSDQGEYAIEAPFVYRDGRTGVVKTVMKVNSV